MFSGRFNQSLDAFKRKNITEFNTTMFSNVWIFVLLKPLLTSCKEKNSCCTKFDLLIIWKKFNVKSPNLGFPTQYRN